VICLRRFHIRRFAARLTTLARILLKNGLAGRSTLLQFNCLRLRLLSRKGWVAVSFVLEDLLPRFEGYLGIKTLAELGTNSHLKRGLLPQLLL
jgi:hypothetical protein